MSKKYNQLVLVEFDNASPAVVNFESDTPIDIELVARYYIQTEDFKDWKDSITFIDTQETINLDEFEPNEFSVRV